jgi:hypothetical protein
MKNLILIALTLTALTAKARVWYVCDGTDEEGQQSSIDLVFASADKVQVVDTQGDEFNIELDQVTGANQVFADYGYDGYGGFVELKIPKSFRLAQTTPFKAKFEHQVFSEIGHIATFGFEGTCVPGIAH